MSVGCHKVPGCYTDSPFPPRGLDENRCSEVDSKLEGLNHFRARPPLQTKKFPGQFLLDIPAARNSRATVECRRVEGKSRRVSIAYVRIPRWPCVASPKQTPGRYSPRKTPFQSPGRERSGVRRS